LLSERRARRSDYVIRFISALALASFAAAAAATAATKPDDTLVSNAAWWEKVTVTIAGDKAQSCHFVSSLRPNDTENCSVSGDQTAMAKGSGSKDELTRITFERRFTPGAKPDAGNLETGDTFLGGQVMALAIDGAGSVKACQVVAESGSMKPEYGCDEASAEQFEASVGGQHKQSARIGYMTILVYGHAEHMV
jgi:hypothetical protein